MEEKTFGDKVLNFYDTLNLTAILPEGITAIYPLENDFAKKYSQSFYNCFFNDKRKRVLVFGINPGRFGSGVTGINFTDPVALEEYCGIKNDLPKRRELSSEFVYKFINAWGGVKKFYSDFFLTALSPVGFLNGGLNYNYYDDEKLFQGTKSFIVETLFAQHSFGAYDHAIVFGSGKNYDTFMRLNGEHKLFDKVYPLEHPRFIMQYKRKYVDQYIRKYLDVFSEALLSR